MPKLMYHATTMNRYAWDAVMMAIPCAHTYIQVEFPGSGESSMPNQALTIERLVEDSVRVLDSLGVDKFHVAGYFLGGVTAAAVASMRSDRVITPTMLCG